MKACGAIPNKGEGQFYYRFKKSRVFTCVNKKQCDNPWLDELKVSIYFFCYMKCTSMLSSYTTRFKQGYTKNKTTPYMTRYFFCVAFIMFKLYLYFYYQPKKLCQVKLFHADKVNFMPCGMTLY